MEKNTIQRPFLLVLVVCISLLFLYMIRSFLLPIFLAGLFSAMAHPLYRWVCQKLRNRRALSSGITLLIIILVVLLPLTTLFGIVTAQAIKVGQSVTPWVQKQLAEPDAVSQFLANLPFYEQVAPYRDTIIEKAGELVGTVSGLLINGLQAFTMGTVNLVFMLFIFLYATFFFLMDGDKLLEKILYYMPLESDDEEQMLNRFTSVTRATIKGTALIGVMQGGLAGFSFFVAGVPSAVFWGTVMTVLSIIPGIGTALVWGPAAIVLVAQGHWGKGIGIALFCGLAVGSVDNLLRPRLVGKDTKMHDLMILFSTLGGITLFGIIGFVIGPIIAALFITIWEIYGTAFKESLPEVRPLLQKAEPEEPQAVEETEEEIVEDDTE